MWARCQWCPGYASCADVVAMLGLLLSARRWASSSSDVPSGGYGTLNRPAALVGELGVAQQRRVPLLADPPVASGMLGQVGQERAECVEGIGRDRARLGHVAARILVGHLGGKQVAAPCDRGAALRERA